MSVAAGTPVKPKRREKDKAGKKKKGLKKAKKGNKSKKKKKQQEAQEPIAGQPSAQDDYWDEEDELEEYIMKKDLGQTKACSGSDSESSNSDTEGGLQHTRQCPKMKACGLDL